MHPNLPRINFSHFVVDPINMTEKYFGQNVMNFGTKTRQTNPRWLDFVLKTSEHLFLGLFVVVIHERRPRKVQVKISSLFEARKPPKMAKLKIKPRWLGFVPKTCPHSFWFISYLFPFVRLKKDQVKISQLLAWKLAEVGNQPKMTSFCTQTFLKSFSVFLLLFPINMDKKCFSQNFMTFGTKTRQTCKNLTWIGFASKMSKHSFLCRFMVVWQKWTRKLQVKISWLFQTWKLSKLAKSKAKPRWLSCALETYPHAFRFISYCYLTQKCFGQNFMTFGPKTCWSWEPTKDE